MRQRIPPGLTNLYSAALAAGVPKDWLKSEALANRIPHVRIGVRLLFNKDAVIKAIQDRATTLPREVAHAG